MPEPTMSVAAALRAAALAAGDRPAMIKGDRQRGYRELEARAERVAAALAERGVRAGSTVAIALFNSFEYVEAVYAAFKLGAQPVNVNYRYREQELRYVLEYTGAAALVYDVSLAERLGGVVSELAAPIALVEVGGGASLPEALPYEHAAGSGATGFAPTEDSPHGIILLTGGTTGTPKGVIWDRDGLLGIFTSIFRQHGLATPRTPAEVGAAVRALQAGDQVPVVLPMSPLMHGTGFFNSMRTLMGGGVLCFSASRSLDADEVWQTVQHHAVTEMVIVGDAFGRPLTAALEAAERDGRPYELGSLRRITSSGVLWSAEVKRELLRRGRKLTLVDNISASEGGPFGLAEVSSEAEVADGRFSLASVARVLDEHDRDVEPGSGQVGVLASAGPQPVGYLHDPDRTARIWRTIDGVRYAVPGDLASLDADGRLILLGRGDGVVNTGGEKVFPEEVEQALITHPAVDDAIVVGIPDPRWGQIVTAVVAPAGALGEVPDDELIQHVRDRLAAYKSPRRIIRVAVVPRTPAGKANRSLARQLVTDRTSTEETA
ncbi:putative fatty-acid-CoA ligase FadD [Acrocarpospora corrugata]|uniref:Putative fatty-acid-CoA ligase FadD n=1 Tax=Acrocarpospora corrugata TaxID=35763 RepID=A0A5M3VSL6_9ACTN|nr:AMP-binding protein [Acrocarpospora corrugata]GER99198.1 putative fatty-acid-CoA ligase FadD [Acrocarpospora corrugata]